MTEFLKLNLEDDTQPAVVRLTDATFEEDTTIVEARFADFSTRLVRFGSDESPKGFELSYKEMDALAEAWLDYRKRVEHFAVEQENARKRAIAEAKALASSIHFDYEPLNVKVYTEGYFWNVECPAIAFKRQRSTEYPQDLPQMVQEALTMLGDRVAYAERNGWSEHKQWKQIVASYRKVFPLEPAEIAEARKLLKEQLHLTEWANCSVYPGTEAGTYSFNGPFGGEGEILMPDEEPAALLAHIKEWLERKESDKELDAMNQKDNQRIPELATLNDD